METHKVLDTSNAAVAARYDEIPYAALPHPLTHPDRLATVATFLGMRPPNVAQCRVLELGCNDGANLIPMAMSLPSAEFVGCDLSARALDAGRRVIAELGLSNTSLVEEDLAALSPSHGTFDYIVAHGIYSWVPAQVRDAVFALARARLSPNGVMFVSWNALPGCRVRQAAWEVLHAHVDRIENPRLRLTEARKLARIIGEGGKAWYDEAVRAEFRLIAQRSDSEVFHDDLAVPNDPVYFREFVAHAARFGLKYLAEVDLRSMSAADLSADARALLSTLDPLMREQYLDYIRLRRFRQSLLCRSDAQSEMKIYPERVAAMHVSADPSLLRAAEAGKVGELASGLDTNHGEHGPVRVLLDTLVQRSPGAVTVAELKESIGVLPRPMETILTHAFVSSIVSLHVHPASFATTATERPVASPLARLQARDSDAVTSLAHVRVRLSDEDTRRLLTLLDGTRDRAALATAMSGPTFGDERDKARAFVDYGLEQFARLALLCT
jgi:SAM-dependent methyltransferase